MVRRGQIAVLALVVATTLTGCAGGSSVTTKSTSSPTAGQSTEQAVETDVVTNFCDLVDSKTLDRLRGDYTAQPDLMLGKENFVGCDADGMSSFEFGVRVIDDSRPLSDYLLGEQRPVQGIGDEALIADSSGPPGSGETMVARRGEVVGYVRNDLLQYGKERSTHQDTVNVLTSLLDLSPQDVAALPRIQVAQPCPTTSAAAAVIGPVALARGGKVNGALDCSYYGDNGLRLLVSQVVGDNAADFVLGDTSVTIPGTSTATVFADEHTVNVDALSTKGSAWLVDSTVIGPDVGAVPNRDAVIALVRDLARLR